MERRRFLGALGGLSAASALGSSALRSSAVDSSALESSTQESAAANYDPSPSTSSAGDEVESAAELGRDQAADWEVAWRTELPRRMDRPTGFQLHSAAETVVAAPRPLRTDDGDAPWTVGLDSQSGEVQWNGGADDPAGAVVTSDGVVVLPSVDSESRQTTLSGSSLHDEQFRWEQTLDAETTGPVGHADGTVLVPASEQLVAVDTADGAVRWRSEHEDRVTGVAVAEGIAYATTSGGAVIATSLADGERRWRVDLADASGLRGPAVSGERVVARDDAGTVHGVGTDGTAAWTSQPEGTVNPESRRAEYGTSVGALGIDGETCYVSTAQEREDGLSTAVTALALADGSVRWQRDLHPVVRGRVNAVQHGPVTQPAVSDGVVWGIGRETVVALDAATGDVRRRWHLATPARSVPLVTDDRVYLATEIAVYALDRAGGDCSAVSVGETSGGYVFERGDAVLHAAVGLQSEDCPHLVAAELRVDGDLLGVDGTVVGPEIDPSVLLLPKVRWDDMPTDVDSATVRVRGADGTVVAEETVSVTDYRDQPAKFTITCGSLDAYTIGVGEWVRATVQVTNGGYERGYVATLEADGEVVDRKTGDLAPLRTDSLTECMGEELVFNEVFLGLDARDLQVRVAPRGEEGEADTESFGTVQVGSPVALALAGVGAAVGTGYQRWWQD